MNYESIAKYIPKKDWIKDFSSRVKDGEIWQHSAFVTYYILLTAFPLIVGIINWLQQLEQDLSGMIWFFNRVAPEPLAEQIINDMGIIYENSNVGILLIATVSTVWTVSWTMASTLMGLNRAYGVKNRKNIVVLRVLAFLLTFVFAGWITGIVFFIQTFTSTTAGRWLTFIPLAFLTFCLLYYLVPNVFQKVRNVIPGALFSTGAMIIGIIGYRLYIYQIPDESTFFTLTGSFMVLLALIQKMSLAILAGGSINATFMEMTEGTIRAKNEKSKFVRLLRKTGLIRLVERRK